MGTKKAAMKTNEKGINHRGETLKQGEQKIHFKLKVLQHKKPGHKTGI